MPVDTFSVTVSDPAGVSAVAVAAPQGPQGEQGIQGDTGPQGPSITEVTTSQLSSLTPEDGNIFITSGFNSVGDGGGNTFYYDADSEAALVTGLVVNGPGGIGRFIAVDQIQSTPEQRGVFPVREGDPTFLVGSEAGGVYTLNTIEDASITTERTQRLQAWIYDLYSKGIHCLVLPPGIYQVNASIVLPQWMSLRGTSNFSTFLVAAKEFTGDALITTAGYDHFVNTWDFVVEALDTDATIAEGTGNDSGYVDITVDTESLQTKLAASDYVRITSSSVAAYIGQHLVRRVPNSTSIILDLEYTADATGVAVDELSTPKWSKQLKNPGEGFCTRTELPQNNTISDMTLIGQAGIPSGIQDSPSPWDVAEYTLDAIRVYAAAPKLQNLKIFDFKGWGIHAIRGGGYRCGSIDVSDDEELYISNVTVKKVLGGIYHRGADALINDITISVARDEGANIAAAAKVDNIHVYGCNIGVLCENSMAYFGLLECEHCNTGLKTSSNAWLTSISQYVSFGNTLHAIDASSQLQIGICRIRHGDKATSTPAIITRTSSQALLIHGGYLHLTNASTDGLLLGSHHNQIDLVTYLGDTVCEFSIASPKNNRLHLHAYEESTQPNLMLKATTLGSMNDINVKVSHASVPVAQLPTGYGATNNVVQVWGKTVTEV